MKRKLFYLVTALFLLVTGTVSAQKLDAILTNMRYDATEDAIVFTIKIKAGEGYIPGTNMGSVLAATLQYDLFLEPGVETLLTPYAATAALTGGAINVRDIGCGWSAPLPMYGTLAQSPTVGLTFSILCLGMDNPMLDFSTDVYYSVAEVKIPVTSKKKPGQETFLRQRPTIERSEASPGFPYLYRSFWGASQTPMILNGSFADQEDFHLEGCADCDRGFILKGTVFPFVHFTRPDMIHLNTLFPVTVELHAVPDPATTIDPVGVILSPRFAKPLYSTMARYYDGTEYVPGTPKNPGKLGFNNPGLPIDWNRISGQPIEAGDPTSVEKGEVPGPNVGLYTFENVPAGDYVLVIKRAGFIPRMGLITVGGDEIQLLGHREIIGGDVNGDRIIDGADVALITKNNAISTDDPAYRPIYDINGNGSVDITDVSLVGPGSSFTGFEPEVYRETKEWIDLYRSNE